MGASAVIRDEREQLGHDLGFLRVGERGEGVERVRSESAEEEAGFSSQGFSLFQQSRSMVRASLPRPLA